MTVMAFQAQRRGRYDESTALFAETVTLWERLGDVTAVELAISNVAHSAKTAGDFQLARRLLEQLLASSQARGDIRAFTSALNGLGDVAAAEGNHDAARRYYQESLARYRDMTIAGVSPACWPIWRPSTCTPKTTKWPTGR